MLLPPNDDEIGDNDPAALKSLRPNSSLNHSTTLQSHLCISTSESYAHFFNHTTSGAFSLQASTASRLSTHEPKCSAESATHQVIGDEEALLPPHEDGVVSLQRPVVELVSVERLDKRRERFELALGESGTVTSGATAAV